MNEITNLLWTGGWDSTYRMLQLLLLKNKMVQPYYLIASERHSADLEIATMDKIRELLHKKMPLSTQLLLPTIYKQVSQIQPNAIISQHYKGLRAIRFLGNQYDFLARFAAEAKINALELSVHKDDHAQKFLMPYVIKDDNGNYRLNDYDPASHLSIFKYFRFPILDLTKTAMYADAQKHGFLELMNQTVFCHYPMRNNKPCGACNPCRYTIEEGLGWRVPLKRRIIYRIKQILPFSLK